jgi:hypothetical protein
MAALFAGCLGVVHHGRRHTCYKLPVPLAADRNAQPVRCERERRRAGKRNPCLVGLVRRVLTTRARRSRVDVRGSRRHLDAPRRATHAREGCRLYSDLGRVGRRRRNPRVVISYRLSVFVRTQNTGTGSRSHDLPGTTFGGHLINWGSGRDKGMGSFCRCALPATTTLHPSRRRRSRPSTTH